jgi:hypothetical protein
MLSWPRAAIGDPSIPGPAIGSGGFVGSCELDAIRDDPHQTLSRHLSDDRFLQCLTFVHRNVLGPATPDFILWIVIARMVHVSLIYDVTCMHLDDRAADLTGLRVPGHPIADFESLRHHEPPITV